jgi:hypothetical protein
LESATPADHPVGGVEVDNDVVFHFIIMAWSTAAMLPSFISLNNNNELYKKRGHKRVIYSIYKQ